MGTLASGPCSNCDPNSETIWKLADLRDERDLGLMREGELAELIAAAESWNGVDCPTPEQFNAIMQLNARGERGDRLTDNRGDKCSYSSQEVCGEGRPFLVNGRARLPSVAAEVGAAGDVVDAVDWLADAKMEHASVAAFARLALQLLALGAPVDLIRDAQRASLDELRHAQFCFAMASREAGTELRAGPIPVQGALDDVSLESLIETNLLEGCLGETLAAERVRRRAADATDAHVQRALLEIGDDELRHAELAFRILAWCSRQAPERTASVIERLLSEVACQARFEAGECLVWREVLGPLLFSLRRATELAA
jgi:hypothetical protein